MKPMTESEMHPRWWQILTPYHYIFSFTIGLILFGLNDNLFSLLGYILLLCTLESGYRAGLRRGCEVTTQVVTDGLNRREKP